MTWATRLVLCCVLIFFGDPTSADSSTDLVSIGSDTFREIINAWGKRYLDQNPQASFRSESKGSATAIAALNERSSHLAPMSRDMTAAESAAFAKIHGYQPMRFQVAVDAVSIYVHRDNPIKGLTIPQLAAIYGHNPPCEFGPFVQQQRIDNWQHLSFGQRGPIHLYGRNQLSGTYAFIQEHVLCGGHFKPTLTTQPNSQAVVDAVANDPLGIGYAGLGYRDERVRTLALSSQGTSFNDGYYSYFVQKFADSPDLEKRYAWVYRGKYPLARDLSIYVDKAPTAPLATAVAKFVAIALSDEGQTIVHELGFIPLSAQQRERQMNRLTAAMASPAISP